MALVHAEVDTGFSTSVINRSTPSLALAPTSWGFLATPSVKILAQYSYDVQLDGRGTSRITTVDDLVREFDKIVAESRPGTATWLKMRAPSTDSDTSPACAVREPPLFRNATLDCRQDDTVAMGLIANDTEFHSAEKTLVGFPTGYKWSGDFSWCRNVETGVYHYTPKAVTEEGRGKLVTHRYRTQRGIEKCLANKHVVLSGDSRVRYQYAALLWAIAGNDGVWDLPDMPVMCEDLTSYRVWRTGNPKKAAHTGCRAINEKFFGGDWGRYWATNAAAVMAGKNNDKSIGTETDRICNCERHNPYKAKEKTENHFFHKKLADGSTIKVTFISTFFPGDVVDNAKFPPTRPIDNTADPFPSQDRRCFLQDTTEHSRTCLQGQQLMNISTYITTVLPKLRPTHVFMSTGWEYAYTGQQEDISCDLLKAQEIVKKDVEGATFRMVRQPLPRSADKAYEPLDIKCPDIKVMFKKLHTGVPRHWQYDRYHSYSNLNREYNNLLLNEMCPFSDDM